MTVINYIFHHRCIAIDTVDKFDICTGDILEIDGDSYEVFKIVWDLNRVSVEVYVKHN